jgi:hypothetical protein
MSQLPKTGKSIIPLDERNNYTSNQHHHVNNGNSNNNNNNNYNSNNYQQHLGGMNSTTHGGGGGGEGGGGYVTHALAPPVSSNGGLAQYSGAASSGTHTGLAMSTISSGQTMERGQQQQQTPAGWGTMSSLGTYQPQQQSQSQLQSQMQTSTQQNSVYIRTAADEASSMSVVDAEPMLIPTAVLASGGFDYDNDIPMYAGTASVVKPSGGGKAAGDPMNKSGISKKSGY